MSREVYVTGVGIISPAGLTSAATWDALIAGTRCVRHDRDWSEQIGAPIVTAPVCGFPTPSGSAHRDRMCLMALAAAQEATAGSILAFSRALQGMRLGISVGTSKGGIQQFGRVATAFHGHASNNALDPASTYDIPPDSAARAIAEEAAMPVCLHATVAACTTGTLSVIRGMQMILDDEADVVICGGADASIHPLWLAAFHQMGAMAKGDSRHGPAFACRPFDRHRNGFVVGEGAGILVLESARARDQRGRRPLARLAGYVCATDPAGLTQLAEEGDVLLGAARMCCDRAGVAPGDLAAIHAHGTGTLTNDVAEARAFQALLGDRVSDVPVVSVKGAIGHLLGAAGAVELGLATLACERARTFGNVTLVDPDPACRGLSLPRESISLRRGAILKTAMGFGGHVAAVLVQPF